MLASKYSSSEVVQLGAGAGAATCLIYAAIVATSPSGLTEAVLAAAIGPLLGGASWGLREFINVDYRRLSSDLGAGANALAGALLSASLLVQLAVKDETGDGPAAELEAVWLGLDVAWDAYIGLGTILFGISALAHPRLGRIFGLTGIAIGAALLVLNLASFPTPPANAGSIDIGPLVGLWYLAVTLVIFRSLSWVRANEERHAR
jgi:hypothetical protein